MKDIITICSLASIVFGISVHLIALNYYPKPKPKVHAKTEVEHDGVMYPVHLKGYVDRIFSDGDDGYVLMELKTGKWKDAPYKYSSMRLEMEFYKNMIILAERDEFLPVTHWAWEYPNGQVNGGDGADWIIEETKTKSKLDSFSSNEVYS